MPGFSKKDQGRLAFLVLGHRGKLEKISGLARDEREWQLVFTLRLAALFNRARHGDAPKIAVRRLAKGFRLRLPEGWLEKNSMTAGGLEDEVRSWRSIGFEIDLEVS
jgi:exopolyphosphatase/guanosine-5'-triphosphate,3'-diphosphate pyrophosphatase